MITRMDRSGGVIGRDPELAAVAAFVAGLGGEFAQLTLEGEAGIGKTTLWREALQQASARGAQVLVTRPGESEATLSFAALGDLFDAVDEGTIGRLPIPQREAISAALLRTSTQGRGIDERAVCAGVLSLLRLVSANGPLVIGVDDVQWLDPPSARALSFAVRRLQREPVAFVMTARTGVARSVRLDRAAEPARRGTIRVGPLSLASLHELIKQRTNHSLSRHTLVQIARETGGNALYALEIAAELQTHPVEGRILPMPSTLTELIAVRLGRLPAASRQALLAAAALAQPTIDLVDPVALVPAQRAGLISIDESRIRFTHPFFASVVYGQASEAQRRRLHRDLAEVVIQPEERARHAALGTAQTDEGIADELDAAAELAGRRGARDTAAELLELAVRLTPVSAAAKRPERLVAAARYWFDAGDFTRSEEMLEQMLGDTLDGTVRAQALLLLGQIHARRSSFTRATQVALEALDLAADDQELRAGIGLDLAYYCVSLGDFAGAERSARSAVASAEGSAHTAAMADALAVLTMAEFLCGRGLDEDRIRRARELEDPWRVRTWQHRPTFLHGLLLLWTCRLDEARTTLEHLHIETRERGEENHLPFLCLYLTWACLWQGDLRAAGAYAAEAKQTAALLDDPASWGTALSASALVHAYDGSSALAREEVHEAVASFTAIDWPSGTIWPLWALGLTELSTGNPAAVDAALGPLADMVFAMGESDPVLSVFLPDEIEALVELGQLDRAEALIAWLEKRGAELDRSWTIAVAARCRGLLHAARGDKERAMGSLVDAMNEHRRFGMPLERARTQLALGRVQRRSGQRARAGASLQEALTVFDHLGTPTWAARTRDELARLGGRTVWSDALTPTEARVAELAATGLANREIAKRAFLTTKAVEANLTRVYRKLGISSRGGLARALEAPDERGHS